MNKLTSEAIRNTTLLRNRTINDRRKHRPPVPLFQPVDAEPPSYDDLDHSNSLVKRRMELLEAEHDHGHPIDEQGKIGQLSGEDVPDSTQAVRPGEELDR